MTWSAQAIVRQSLTVDGKTTIRAVAVKGESHTVTYDDREYTLEHLTSNTEGDIQSVEVTIKVDGETSIEVGDVIQMTGHFTNDRASAHT